MGSHSRPSLTELIDVQHTHMAGKYKYPEEIIHRVSSESHSQMYAVFVKGCKNRKRSMLLNFPLK